jgi:hypothetical protein
MSSLTLIFPAALVYANIIAGAKGERASGKGEEGRIELREARDARSAKKAKRG